MSVRLKHITTDKDRHGNVRVYFRKNGRKIRLRAEIGSLDFISEYQLAMTGQHPKQIPAKVPQTTAGESMRELIEGYYKSSSYMMLSDRTRHVRRQILDRFCSENGYGTLPFATLEAHHLMRWRDARVDKPEAANSTIKALRQVYKYAMEYGFHDANPAALVSNLPGNGCGHIAWSAEDIENFEAVHPVGSMARLAMALALYTGQRRGDLVRLGEHHIQVYDGLEGFELTQQKNSQKRKAGATPVRLWIPITRNLREIMNASPMGKQTFIQTEFGRPFTADGFGNRFRKWCADAGLENRSAHGLRKTASAVLAQSGCTEQEIMAITGHRTSKEVIRYTRSASQKIRAANAMQKISADEHSEGD